MTDRHMPVSPCHTNTHTHTVLPVLFSLVLSISSWHVPSLKSPFLAFIIYHLHFFCSDIYEVTISLGHSISAPPVVWAFHVALQGRASLSCRQTSRAYHLPPASQPDSKRRTETLSKSYLCMDGLGRYN